MSSTVIPHARRSILSLGSLLAAALFLASSSPARASDYEIPIELVSLQLQGAAPIQVNTENPPTLALTDWTLRLSPTLPSRGATRLRELPSGEFQVDSFFDIFTELSFDGGNNWIPSPGAIRLNAVQGIVPTFDPLDPSPFGGIIPSFLPTAIDWDIGHTFKDPFQNDVPVNLQLEMLSLSLTPIPSQPPIGNPDLSVDSFFDVFVHIDGQVNPPFSIELSGPTILNLDPPILVSTPEGMPRFFGAAFLAAFLAAARFRRELQRS